MAAENKGGIVRVQKRDESYTILDPYFLSDERLTWKAKGLLGYLLSKPSNWRVYVSDLVKRSKDGRDAVYSALNELEEAGYIDRKQMRENGKITGMETVVYERPIVPLTDNPDMAAEPLTENPDTVESDADIAEHNSIDLNNIDSKNECMNGARDISFPDSERISDPVLAALTRSLAAIPLTDTHSVGDFYFADIYAALVRHFTGRLDPEVIEIAAEHYARAAIDVRTNLPKITVKNPVGLFVDAYRTALVEWKAVRYKRRRRSDYAAQS